MGPTAGIVTCDRLLKSGRASCACSVGGRVAGIAVSERQARSMEDHQLGQNGLRNRPNRDSPLRMPRRTNHLRRSPRDNAIFLVLRNLACDRLDRTSVVS